jgi:hypothetical protein
LRHELAANGQVEDRLPQLLDMFGAGREARQVVKGEAGMVAERGIDRALS